MLTLDRYSMMSYNSLFIIETTICVSSLSRLSRPQCTVPHIQRPLSDERISSTKLGDLLLNQWQP